MMATTAIQSGSFQNCAAAIGVMGRYVALRYKDGRLYRGSAGWQEALERQSEQRDE